MDTAIVDTVIVVRPWMWLAPVSTLLAQLVMFFIISRELPITKVSCCIVIPFGDGLTAYTLRLLYRNY